MTKDEILMHLTRIVETEVEEEGLELFMDSTSLDVFGWDSIAHVGIIVNTEEFFGIKFSPKQITSIQSVGEMVDTINHLLEEANG